MQDENDNLFTSSIDMKHLAEMQRLQLLLAEQRTSLSLLRTGIAIFSLPLSVLTVLIATSRYYQIKDILYLLIPTGIIVIGLVAFAIWMIVRAMQNLFHLRKIIDKLKERDEYLREYW